MFGCLLEIECVVSTYCFHGDVFQQSIIYKTRYQTLAGLSLFALTAALYLTHTVLPSPHLTFKIIFIVQTSKELFICSKQTLWTSMSLSRRKGKGGEITSTISWSGCWKHLTLWDSEKGFPNIYVREFCIHERKSTTLALWFYQKEREGWKEILHIF